MLITDYLIGANKVIQGKICPIHLMMFNLFNISTFQNCPPSSPCQHNPNSCTLSTLSSLFTTAASIGLNFKLNRVPKGHVHKDIYLHHVPRVQLIHLGYHVSYVGSLDCEEIEKIVKKQRRMSSHILDSEEVLNF